MLRRIIFGSLLFITVSADDWWRNTHRLHDKLFANNYSVDVNPQPEHNHSTKVFVHQFLRSHYIDDFTQTLTLNSWMYMHWMDSRLTWDPKLYGDIAWTTVGRREVWKPDLLVYNSADPTNLEHYGNAVVHLDSSGSVAWMPPMTTLTECPMDLTYWPFDTQKCFVTMGSWTTHGLQIDFIVAENTTTEHYTSDYIKPSQHWKINHVSLVRRSTIYECCKEPYVDLTLEVTMTRSSPFFLPAVIIPAFAIALLTLVQFLLPVDYPPRVTVGLASALICVIIIAYLSAILPPLSDSCPLIVKYYAMTLLLTVFSVALNGVMARISMEQPEVLSVPPPALVKTVVTGPLATVLCIRTIADKVGRSSMGNMDNDEEILGERKSFQHEWVVVAAAVDRVVALTYVVLFTFGFIGFVSPLH